MVNVRGWATLTSAAAPRAPARRRAFRQACRTENTAERPAGPARLASRASWAGQIIDTPRPSRPAAPNRAAAPRARARAAEPAAATARPAISARRGVHRSAAAPPIGVPASDATAIVATTRPAVPEPTGRGPGAA